MKNGFRVYDVDTHINPGAEVLERLVGRWLRRRRPELARYKVAIQSREAGGGERHIYRCDEKVYERTLGEAEPRKGSRDGRVWRGRLRPSPGVQDDNAANRVHDMDVEGADRHFLIPSAWTACVGHPDVSIEVNLIRAYHRHMHDFCRLPPARLKGPIVASTRNVAEAVREIRDWRNS